jgi:hypothetical protein
VAGYYRKFFIKKGQQGLVEKVESKHSARSRRTKKPTKQDLEQEALGAY